MTTAAAAWMGGGKMGLWAFPDGDGGWWFGAAGFVTAILTGIGALYQTWSKRRQETRQATAAIESARLEAEEVTRAKTIAEWQRIASMWQEQSERKDAVIEQAHELYMATFEDIADCRECWAEDRGTLKVLYEMLKRYAAALKELGKDMGDIPPPPPPLKDRPDRSVRRMFLANQLQQSKELLGRVDEKIREGVQNAAHGSTSAGSGGQLSPSGVPPAPPRN